RHAFRRRRLRWLPGDQGRNARWPACLRWGKRITQRRDGGRVLTRNGATANGRNGESFSRPRRERPVSPTPRFAVSTIISALSARRVFPVRDPHRPFLRFPV